MKILRCKIRYLIYIIYAVVLLTIIREILFKVNDKNIEKKVYLLKKNITTILSTNERYEQWINDYMKNVSPTLGEYGKAAFLSEKETVKGIEVLKKRAVNIILSNKIPLQRKLPDVRNSLCKNVTYDMKLPTGSIIIIFHNEAFSLLLRTVYSVLNETPPKLLKEIILVDDKSDEEELQGLLEYFIQTRMPKKVKLLRLQKREGLVGARLKGAKSSTGDVLMFLDAHCEVTKEWLQPLLQRIKNQRNVVVTPVIDEISEKNFEYVQGDPTYFQVGGFTWSGHFTWINVQESELRSKSPISSVKSPTMAGGLFAINREYFWEIGGYDNKMDGWGGENLEMSFRIWQCGGILETVPCSKVGHVFRNFLPYKIPMNKDSHGINTMRLANVWMDDYKRLFYLYNDAYKNQQNLVGDIEDRIKLRKKLKCKSFKWYLKNIYPEKFILDENVQAFGRVRVEDKNLCLDFLQHDEEKPYNLGVYTCHSDVLASQFFSLSKTKELRRDETCATVIEDKQLKEINKVSMRICDEMIDSDKEWQLTQIGNILHLRSGLCLDVTGINSSEDIQVKICSDSPNQIWQFDFYGEKITPR